MTVTTDSLGTQLLSVQDQLRAVLGDGGAPPAGQALMLALARPLATSGLVARTVLSDRCALVATGGDASGGHLLLLVGGEESAGDEEPGGGRASLVAALTALAAIRAASGQLPVAVTLVCDPDRALGSPSLATLDLPPVDFCLWDGGGYEDNEPWLALGSHGMARARLTARQPGGPVSLGALVPNPAWRLVWELAGLKTANEEVILPGFHEAAREPTAEEIEMAARPWPSLERRVRRGGGPLLGLTGGQLGMAQNFVPTVNILSLGVEAAPAHLPSAAWVDLLLTFAPGQSPDALVGVLGEHLQRHELGDADLDVTAAYAGWETAVTGSLVADLLRRTEMVFGHAARLRPFAEAPAPLAALLRSPTIPALGFGAGRAPWPTLTERVARLSRWLSLLLSWLPTTTTRV